MLSWVSGELRCPRAPQVSEVSPLGMAAQGFCAFQNIQGLLGKELSALGWINHRLCEVCGVSEWNNGSPSPGESSRIWKVYMDYIHSMKYPESSRRAGGILGCVGNHISADRIPGNLTLPNCPRTLGPSPGEGQTVTTVQKTILVIKDLGCLDVSPQKNHRNTRKQQFL